MGTEETMLEHMKAKHLNSQGQWLQCITGYDLSVLYSMPFQAHTTILCNVLPPAIIKCKTNGNR